eukprot:CAMPEP_0206481992 /NCGR_PEP_ID=MMETSP0324_2-20121206/38554_1 /ASSEMBLY_ACC=CAM_ASM_000836 /TAXON_ID=2866 /ORGANISM="Crypthecodinium cohnii, Strain Seligo" /LENGTH=59 /DNA_ID=CAMNT_0053959745 /DNA_START=213 /DNA_END=392 /DNA_ORIENTATION=-
MSSALEQGRSPSADVQGRRQRLRRGRGASLWPYASSCLGRYSKRENSGQQPSKHKKRRG